MSYHFKHPINTHDSMQYRQYLVGLGMPVHEIDTMIEIVYSVMSYFVDQTFNVQTDQITLHSIGKNYNPSLGHAKTENNSENQTANVQNYGVEGILNPIGPSEP